MYLCSREFVCLLLMAFCDRCVFGDSKLIFTVHVSTVVKMIYVSVELCCVSVDLNFGVTSIEAHYRCRSPRALRTIFSTCIQRRVQCFLFTECRPYIAEILYVRSKKFSRFKNGIPTSLSPPLLSLLLLLSSPLSFPLPALTPIPSLFHTVLFHPLSSPSFSHSLSFHSSFIHLTFVPFVHLLYLPSLPQNIIFEMWPSCRFCSDSAMLTISSYDLRQLKLRSNNDSMSARFIDSSFRGFAHEDDTHCPLARAVFLVSSAVTIHFSNASCSPQ